VRIEIERDSATQVVALFASKFSFSPLSDLGILVLWGSRDG
jgi:hypothetical protein